MNLLHAVPWIDRARVAARGLRPVRLPLTVEFRVAQIFDGSPEFSPHELRAFHTLLRRTGDVEELRMLAFESRAHGLANFPTLLDAAATRVERLSRTHVPLAELTRGLPTAEQATIARATQAGWRFRSRPTLFLPPDELIALDDRHHTAVIALSSTLRPEWLLALAGAHISWNTYFAHRRDAFMAVHGLRPTAARAVDYLRDVWLTIDGDALLTRLYAESREHRDTFVLEPWESRRRLTVVSARADAWQKMTAHHSERTQFFLSRFAPMIQRETLLEHLHATSDTSRARRTG